MTRTRYKTRPLLRLLMHAGLLQASLASAAPVDPAALARLVENAIVQRVSAAPAARGAARVEASASAMDSRLRLDPCDSTPQVEIDLSRLQRRMNAKVSCAGPRPWSIYVPAELRLYREVVVSARELAPGTPLTRDDLAIAERDVLAAGGSALSSVDQVLGQVVRRPVAANAIIGTGMLVQQMVVRRGDRLSLSSSAGGITVQTTVEALENGRTGDRIRVRNTQSQRTVDAIVTGPGSAQSP